MRQLTLGGYAAAYFRGSEDAYSILEIDNEVE